MMELDTFKALSNDRDGATKKGTTRSEFCYKVASFTLDVTKQLQESKL